VKQTKNIFIILRDISSQNLLDMKLILPFSY